MFTFVLLFKRNPVTLCILKFLKTSRGHTADSNWPCARGVDAPLAGCADCCHNNRADTGTVWSQRASAGAAAVPGRWSMWRCICGSGTPGPEGGATAWSGWPLMDPHAPLEDGEERVRWIIRLERVGGGGSGEKQRANGSRGAGQI